MKTQKKRVKKFNMTRELFKCSYDIQGVSGTNEIDLTLLKNGQHPNIHQKLGK